MSFLLFLVLAGGTADRVVGVVDEEPILQSEVQAMLNLTLIETPYLEEAPQDSLRSEILDRLVNQRLLFKKAAEDTTIVLDSDEISRRVDKQLEDFYAQLDSFPETKAELEQGGLTPQLLRRVLSNQMRFQSLAQQMFAKEGRSEPYVSPNQVRKFYQANKDSLAVVPGYIEMSHLALGITPSRAEQQRVEREIVEVLDILSRGGDFEVVAQSFSDDAATRSRGGLLGWIKRGESYPEIDSVLFSLPVGEVAGPVPSREGFHLFLVQRRSQDRAYVRHILFETRITRNDTLRVMSKAGDIRQEIVSGRMSFADAARKYSEDATTSQEGGFIGKVPLDALTPPFDSVAATLDSGQVSKPFLSEMGVHLLYARDKKESRVLTFQEVQVQIRNYLAALKQEEWLEEILDRAREEYYVEEKT